MNVHKNRVGGTILLLAVIALIGISGTVGYLMGFGNGTGFVKLQQAQASCPAYPTGFWYASYSTAAEGVQSPVSYAGYCVRAAGEPPTADLVITAPNSGIIAVVYDVKSDGTYSAERVMMFRPGAKVALASYTALGGTTITLRAVYSFTPQKGATHHPELLKYYFGTSRVVADADGYGVCKYTNIVQSVENPRPDC